MEAIAHTGWMSRLAHLNRNERTLQDINARLDVAYRDFVVGTVWPLSPRLYISPDCFSPAP
jgi:hypothetical protein